MKKYLNPEYAVEMLESSDVVTESHIYHETVTTVDKDGNEVVLYEANGFKADNGDLSMNISANVGSLLGQ